MRVLILAAGYATRLFPLTKHWPKPLLLIKEKPIIEHIVKKVQDIKEVKEIIIVTNNKFIHHFQEWAKILNSKKKIVVISDKTTSEQNRLGAIGDLAFIIKNHKIDSDLLVIGGDNLFTFDLKRFAKFAQTKKGDCTVGLYNIKNPDLIKRYGVVSLNRQNKIIKFQEKPKKSESTLISMCIYYLPVKSLHLVQQFLKMGKTQDAPGNYIKWLSKEATVWGYEFDGIWYDIGDIITFYHASVTFKD